MEPELEDDAKMRFGPFHWVFLSVLLLAIFWICLRLFRRRRYLFHSIKHDLTRGHRWFSSEFTDKPTYCNSCMQFCVSGSSCETCGICVCLEEKCLKSVCTKHACKPISTEGNGHTWMRGNLPLASQCLKCLSPCGDIPALVDYRCLWCESTVHEDCIKERPPEMPCSFGPHRRLIIPPNCVTVQEHGWRGKKQVVIKELRPPNIEGWRPLIVLSNPRSGGKDGEMVQSVLRKLLNPIQVIDISETPPENALEICRLIPDHSVRIMVCGGDGTVGWVLGAIDKADLPTKPYVGILPLGTGNDLARVLDWGSGYSSDDDISNILKEIEHAHLSLLDRWEVTIQSRRNYFGLQRNPKTLTMNNYLGIGCDAGVALNFHRQRESRPELFTSRIINKAWYVGFGARDIIEQTCKNLKDKIELHIDDVPQKLPELEGIVILNINSWSSGCSVWTANENWGPSRMDDKVLEIVGLYSSFHMGKIQATVAEPLQIGQAKNVKIVLKESVPIQVDGEPWQQSPSTITVSYQGQAHMLRRISS